VACGPPLARSQTGRTHIPTSRRWMLRPVPSIPHLLRGDSCIALPPDASAERTKEEGLWRRAWGADTHGPGAVPADATAAFYHPLSFYRDCCLEFGRGTALLSQMGERTVPLSHNSGTGRTVRSRRRQ
jgi:hypothetical protein